MIDPPPAPPRRSPTVRRAAIAAVLALVAVAAVVVVVGGSDDGPFDAARTGRAFGVDAVKGGIVPADGTLLGLWTIPDDKSADDATRQALWRAREELVGRPFDIGHEFHPFTEPFPDAMDRFHVAAGRIPMISWNGTSAAEILDGVHDDLIRERARAVHELRRPVLMRFWWEMDIAEKQAWVSTPDDFIAAWRRVHRLFDEAGATNASWVWCPTSLSFGDGTAQQWWPGDAWVDWVCADGYNFAPARPTDVWRPFAEIFDPFYRWATGTGKPIMIGEFGVLERRPGEKEEWLRQANRDLAERFGEIRAAVYFDSRRIVDGAARDWRIDTSPGAARAFAELSTDLAEGVRR